MTYDDIRAIALAWPGVEDTTSYGTPSLKVGKKMLARLKEDGDSLVIPGVEIDERDMLTRAAPAVFYFTDHYKDYPIVLARLSKAKSDMVTGLLARRHRAITSKKILKAWDATTAANNTSPSPSTTKRAG